MGTTLNGKLERLPQERRKRVEERAAQLMAEEMTRQQLRQALKLTQERVAQLLEIDQGNVSRIEQRTDLMLSTLRDYVAALGGELRIVVEFPDRPPVTLVGIAQIQEPQDTSEKV